MSRRAQTLTLVGCAGLVAAFALPSLTFPFGPDQGMIAAMARLWDSGRVPYLDVWDNRSPLLYVIARLAYATGLRGMSMVRVLDLVYQAGTAAALGWVLLRLHGRPAALLGAAFYGYSYFGQADYWHTAQPDGMISLPLALAVALAIGSGPSQAPAMPGPRRLLASGALFGAAFLVKYPALVGGLPILAALWLQAPGEGFRAKVRPLARALVPVAAGAAAAVLAWVAWCAAHGAVRAWFVDTVVYNFAHRGIGGESDSRLEKLLETVGLLLSHREVIAPLLLLPLARLDRRAWILGLWAVAGLGMFLSQGKFWSAHLLPVVAPLAGLSGSALAGLAGRLRAETVPRGQQLRWGLICLLALGAGYRTFVTWCRSAANAVVVTRDAEAREAFLARHEAPYGFSVADNLEVARELSARARPGDRLLSWGFNPMLYYLTPLEPASRFITSHPLLVPGRPREYDAQFAADLAAHRVDFLALGSGDPQPWMTGTTRTSEESAPEQPELARLLPQMKEVLRTRTLVLLAQPDR